ncbi:FtsH protease activity modulator HflK [Desulfonatronovibrio hydrogenovorans]|uniref:FtsH protease activity modulator HflK n=1 Tax=Desulfonatronovibrio hydrogenovorans TaxID=53245 RepID=UPI00068FBF3A|nr:FtsH protease activity modulator HflK [Desulfonatronovibrio hydrogenovorans]
MNWDWEKLQQKRQRHQTGGGPGSQGPDFGDLQDKLNYLKKFKIPGGKFIFIGLAFIIWMLSGLYIVEPGQVGVVQRFGAMTHQTELGAGLQWHWPRPIERATVVDVQRIRTHYIGFNLVNGNKRINRNEALMLTGDKNIAHFEIIVHYRVTEPAEYLFNVREPDNLILKTAAESALRSIVGTMDIETAIVAEGLAMVAQRTQTLLQQLLDDYGSGLFVTDVRTERGDAPQEVRDAFHDVVRAMEDKERLIYRSEQYREDIVPRARGGREERILTAQGEIRRFSQILNEYQLAKDVTRQRMYLEKMADILPGVNKVIVDKGAADSLLLLPGGQSLNLGEYKVTR